MFKFIMKFDLHNFTMDAIKCVCSSSKFNLTFIRYKSHYETLGVEPNASSKDIKSAYYKMSLKHHPDKNKGSRKSIEEFRKVSEAYETLGNAEKKMKYDREINNYSGAVYRGFNRTSFKGYNSTNKNNSRMYNYEEHFRQHYGYSREDEYEYFKRRWEADFYRRYPTPEQYYYRDKRKHEEEEYQEFRRKNRYFSLSSIFLITWVIFFVLSNIFSPNSEHPPRKPLYYKVGKSKE